MRLASPAEHSPSGNYTYATLTVNALRSPNRVAVEDRGREYTYAELNARVNRLANGLLSIGLQPGAVVSCLFDSGFEIAEFYLAMAKVGLVTGGLNPFFELEQLTTVAAASGPTAVVFGASQAERAAHLRRVLGTPRHWIVSSGDAAAPDTITRAELESGVDDTEPPLAGFDDDPMSIYYSSGTTGTPKAILHTHRSNLAGSGGIWLDLPHSAQGAVLTTTYLWGNAFPATIGATLFAGMRAVLEPVLTPANFLNVVPEKHITHAITLPSFWTEIFRLADNEDADFSSLEVVLLGSEPILPSLVKRINTRMRGGSLWSFFGTTEAPNTCLGRIEVEGQALNASGPARQTVAVQIVDGSDKPVIDEVGEIRIRGPHVMAGYIGEPEKTARALRDGWLYTGDLGSQDADGVVIVHGRSDDAIRRTARWILPSEVENALSEVDGVAEVGVVAVGADDDPEILAALVPRPGVELDEDHLRETVLSRVGAHAVPEHIVITDELPHGKDTASGAGKLLRREIRARWQATPTGGH